MCVCVFNFAHTQLTSAEKGKADSLCDKWWEKGRKAGKQIRSGYEPASRQQPFVDANSRLGAVNIRARGAQRLTAQTNILPSGDWNTNGSCSTSRVLLGPWPSIGTSVVPRCGWCKWCRLLPLGPFSGPLHHRFTSAHRRRCRCRLAGRIRTGP